MGLTRHTATLDTTGAIEADQGYTYNGTGCTVVRVASAATLSNNGATAIARTFTSPLTTTLGAWYQLVTLPVASGKAPIGFDVHISGANITLVGFGHAGDAATKAATINLFAVGSVR